MYTVILTKKVRGVDNGKEVELKKKIEMPFPPYDGLWIENQCYEECIHELVDRVTWYVDMECFYVVCDSMFPVTIEDYYEQGWSEDLD